MPDSGTSAVGNLETGTNVGVTGLWLYEIDQTNTTGTPVMATYSPFPSTPWPTTMLTTRVASTIHEISPFFSTDVPTTTADGPTTPLVVPTTSGFAPTNFSNFPTNLANVASTPPIVPTTPAFVPTNADVPTNPAFVPTNAIVPTTPAFVSTTAKIPTTRENVPTLLTNDYTSTSNIPTGPINSATAPANLSIFRTFLPTTAARPTTTGSRSTMQIIVSFSSLVTI